MMRLPPRLGLSASVLALSLAGSTGFAQVTCVPGTDYVTSAAPGVIVPGVTSVLTDCDDCIALVALPFPVAVYDLVFNSVNVTSNGNAQFLSVDLTFTNTCLPNAIFDTTILPHWDDLVTVPSPGCAAYPGGVCGVFIATTGSAPNRTFHIEWRTVYINQDTSPVHFELRLHEENANFEVVYGSVPQGGTSATAGVQRDTGSLFTEIACNTATLASDTQVSYTCALTPVELTGFSAE